MKHSIMLDTSGSTWNWEGEGKPSTTDEYCHYSGVRETLVGGCYRIFRKGDVVVTLQDPSIQNTHPTSVNLAQIVDLFEVPDGDESLLEHMVVIFRWLYHCKDSDEGMQSALTCRDEPLDGSSKLETSDFFMSRFVEEEHNSVESIVGKALLCPTVHEIGDYQKRLTEGRKKTSEALLSGDTSAELDFTASDNVYLCRWYYARADEARSTEVPETGRLFALTKKALQYFLTHSSVKADFVYNKLHDIFMPDGLVNALDGEGPKKRDQRPKLGPARQRRPSEGEQGGRASKKARVVENLRAVPKGASERIEPSFSDDVEIAEVEISSLKTQKRTEGKATGKPPVKLSKVSAGKSAVDKEQSGKGKSVASSSARSRKPSSEQDLKSGGLQARVGAGASVASALTSGIGSVDVNRAGTSMQLEPVVKKKKKSGSAGKVGKLPMANRRDSVLDDVTPVPATPVPASGSSSSITLKKWGLTDPSSDPKPVQRAAKNMTAHLSSLSPEERGEVGDLWRLLVAQLESIRVARDDPDANFTEAEYETAQAKALEAVSALRESRRNDASLSAFSEGA